MSNKQNDFKESELESTNKDKEEPLPFYMCLYPPIEDNVEPEPNLESILNLDLDQKDKKEGQNKNKEKLNETLLTKEILEDLVKKPHNIPKAKILEIVSKALKVSKLIERVEDDDKKSKEISEEDLSLACVKKFEFKKFKKGDIIFRIGDDGEKFYYILKGKANVLKIKEIPNIYMSAIEYINYCIFLIKQRENYLFQEVIRKNYNVLKVSGEEEIFALYRIWFKSTLIIEVNQYIINNNKSLEEYFRANGQQIKDYNLDIKELEILEIDKLNKVPMSFIKWKNYVVKNCELDTKELVLYEEFYKVLMSEQKKKITCLIYESFLHLGPASYFGDSALDSETNKRNATIRVEEDTYLATLKRDDYINIIAPKRRNEKTKAIAFLFYTFFFQQINPHIFERHYFHLFYLREYPKNTVLFDFGENPKNLLLVKEGQISLDLKISVLEIHHLIKFMFHSILNNIYFKDLPKNKKNEILPREVLSQLIKYTHDLRLDRLKMQNYRFIEEMNKVQIFRITLLMGVEAVGLEEIFLELPYLMKGVVVKKVSCYELAIDKVYLMLKEEKHIRLNYAKQSIKKILSLIERLQGIKSNCVEMASSKYNINSEEFFDKVFSTTQMPLIKNSQTINNNTISEQTNRDKDNYKSKLASQENFDYKENIITLLNKINSINKSDFTEKKDETILKKESEIFGDKSQENKEILEPEEKSKITNNNNNLEQINNYKKIEIMTYNENPRRIIPSFKSPITNFIIKDQPDYKKNLKSKLNPIRIKFINLKSDIQNKKKSQNNSSIKKINFFDGPDNSFEKFEGNKTKPKLPNEIRNKNLFFFGENKYCSIKKLKKQIQDFRILDDKRKKVEVIQSNYIVNYYNVKENNKRRKLNNMNNDNMINKYDLKKKLIKFINNFPISFVPISVKYNEKMNNDNEYKNNSSRNFSKLTRNSSYSEKFFASKNMKNIFLINKRNKINMKEQLIRSKSDLIKNQKRFPKLKNTFFTINKFNV